LFFLVFLTHVTGFDPHFDGDDDGNDGFTKQTVSSERPVIGHGKRMRCARMVRMMMRKRDFDDDDGGRKKMRGDKTQCPS